MTQRTWGSLLGILLVGCSSSSSPALGNGEAGADTGKAYMGDAGRDGSARDGGGKDASLEAAGDAMGEAGTDAKGGSDAATKTSDCFPAPGACGFPDPLYDNVGVPKSATLSKSSSLTITTAGMTVHDLEISGSITINAKNVTLKNVQLTVADDGSGTAGISIENGASGTTIEDCTIAGAGTKNSPESAIFNHYGETLTLTRVYLYNFADPIEGPVTVKDSYINANGTYGSGSDVAHIEDIYVSDDTVSVDHSVLFNPSGQTATIFMDTSSDVGDDHLTLTNSLVAGGGWTLYPSAKSTSVGTATMNVSNNRFARCLGTPDFDGSGTTCKGGPDMHGYYPNCGYYGVAADDYCPPIAGQVWTGNVWDDDSSTIPCP
jgi:hypothetical protein